MLKALGIEVRIKARPHSVVFAYFHPLSRPLIQPQPGDIKRQPAIKIDGDAVLRFGFLEGDAIVRGGRVVYDPQTWHDPAHFGANGSLAGELALVLNELELQALTGIKEAKAAAQNLIRRDEAAVVVVKQGIRGAAVIERSGLITQVPAYRSSRVFKIGTGDVFSALFAHYWAERGISPAEAADVASRHVAAYCSVGQLPVKDEALMPLNPVHFLSAGTVAIEGATDTIGQRYTSEEAQFVLRELGTEVFVLGSENVASSVSAVLVLAEGLTDGNAERIERYKSAGTPIVVLQETGIRMRQRLAEGPNVVVTDDFTSAMYFAAWAAAERSFH
jgi:hypothetical protein